MDQESFHRAVASMQAQDYSAAERTFEAVLDTLDAHHQQYNLVLSYLGLAQVLTGNTNGLLLCRDAAANEVFNGDVFLNLAGAEWHSMNRRRAIDAIRCGIKIDAENQQLNHACARLGCRKRCCFDFLPRGHRLNRLFGRWLRRPTKMTTVHSLLYSS